MKRLLGEGRHARFVEEDGWEYAERKGVSGIAVVVAVTPEGRILLVEQARPAVGGARVIELPAGLAGDEPGREQEPLAAAAARELREETGFTAEGLRLLFSGPPSAGLCSEVVTFFEATSLARSGAGGGTGAERIEVHQVPLANAGDWLEERQRAGALIDPKVYAGLWFARRGR